MTSTLRSLNRTPRGPDPRRRSRIPCDVLGTQVHIGHTLRAMSEQPPESLRQAGTLLREARRGVGMSQTDLGDALGVHQTTVSKWEHGWLPSVSDLLRAVRVIGVSLEDVLAPVLVETEPEGRRDDRELIADLLDVLKRRQGADRPAEGDHPQVSEDRDDPVADFPDDVVDDES